MLELLVAGNIGLDATVKDVAGTKVANFTVAHNEKYTDKAGVKQDKTVWVNCEYWTPPEGLIPYLKKGTSVIVKGTPSSEGYLDKNQQVASSLRVRVQRIELIGGSKSADAAAPNAGAYAPAAAPAQKYPPRPPVNYGPPAAALTAAPPAPLRPATAPPPSKTALVELTVENDLPF